MPAIGAIAGAVISGVAANQAAKKQQGAANAAARGGGYVDVTTSRNPDPLSRPYREEGMQAAYNSVFGTDYPGLQGQGLHVQGDPRGGGGSGPVATTGKTPASPEDAKRAWRQQRKAGKTGAAPGSAAAPAAPAARSFDGMSGETDTIRGSMMDLPNVNRGMNETAEGYLTDTLNGEERNAYRPRAGEAADDISDDPELAAYQAAIRQSLGLGPKSGGGGAGGGAGGRPRGGGYSAPAYQQTLNQQPGGYGATGTGAALTKLVAGEAPAGWEGMEAGISRKVNEGRAANIRELRARAVGSGFYGGDLYKELEEGAVAQGDQEMTDSLAAARFGAWQNALNLGTEYDLGMADMGSRERIAGQSASAAGAADAADRESREKLALYGMWGDSVDVGQRGRTSRAGALGDLAGLTSEDQRFAVGGVNDLAGSRRADLGAAGELSLGADANRNNWIAAKRQEGTARAGIRAGSSSDAARLAEQRRQFDESMSWDREQEFDPLNRLGEYSNLLNAFYGGLGSETTTGRDMRGASQPAFLGGSVGGAALSGAALGGQIGSQYQRRPVQPTASGA